jgi:hypothetical protein
LMNELGLLWQSDTITQLMNILLVIWLNKIIGQYRETSSVEAN